MQKTLIKAQASGDAASGATQQVEVPSQAVRITGGELAEMPFNRFSLFDTRAVDRTVLDFFQPSPSGSRAESNYDAVPPNSSEPTFITALGASLSKAILRGTTGVDAIDFVNRIQSGIIQVLRTDTQAVLVEEPAQRFFDFSGIQIQGDNIVLPTISKPTALSEAVMVPTGISYRIRLQLGAGKALPSTTEWNNSNGSVPAIRITADHRGSNGR